MAARSRSILRPILPAVLMLACFAVRADDPVRVMLLFGASDLGVWPQQFSSAFLRHPDVREHQPPVSISTELLGLYQAGPEGLDHVLQSLRHKQATDAVDVVVAVQGLAARFLADHGDDVYPGVPRLYVLPGRVVTDELAGRGDSVVLPSAIVEAIGGTIETMADVLPDFERVWIITGARELDVVYHDHAREAVARLKSPPPVEYLHGLTLEELERRLREAPEGTGVLLLTYEGDPAGKIYRTVPDALPRLLEHSRVPLFGAFDSLLGAGIVGGVMTSTESYGRQAARMAVAIAARGAGNVSPGEPVLRTAFDAGVVRGHGLGVSRLPAGSEIINEATPAYLDYLWETVAAAVVIVVQLALIVTLWRLLRQRQRSNRALARQARDLERQKVLFESVINSISDAIVITDVGACIIATNTDGFRRTFGYDPERIIGQPSHVLTGGEPLDAAGAGGRIPAVREFSGRSGRRFPGEWAATPILTEQGEHLGLALVVRDVSERLAVEEERRQAHKMEALGSLAGGIAHDFNNILTVILGHAELIQAGAADSAQSVEQILRAGNRARDLVGQILAFSRRGTRREMGPVDLRPLIEESAGFLRASMPSTIVLDVYVAPGADTMVHANEGELQQVLMNLGANARDAMGPKGGSLSVRVDSRLLERGKVVSHGILRQGRYLCIEVRDSGAGMNREVQQRAFDPFFTTKGPGEGTGMGLAQVYGIVQTLDGAIDLRSAPQRGTAFTLYLPALEASVDDAWPSVPAAVLEGPEATRPNVRGS